MRWSGTRGRLCTLATSQPPPSFHKQRCAAGWLTGLGSRASSLFAHVRPGGARATQVG